MYLKKFKNIKLISIQDIVSLSLISIILLCSITTVLGNSTSVEATTQEVSTRNLAMFASLAYVDFENLGYNMRTSIDKSYFKEGNAKEMVTDDQLKSIYTSTGLFGTRLDVKTKRAENTYDYLFYGLASTSEVKDWKIINYSKIKTTLSSKHALFTAVTFKKNNDIVIAYRGTDFDDLGDWIEDIVGYGIIGKTGQEGQTEKYAKTVARMYPNANIYVTGHSLGGFLAQIGGSALIEEGYSNQLKGIEYFNGIGLRFISNLKNTLDNSKIKTAIKQIDNDAISKTKAGSLSEKINNIKNQINKLNNDKEFIRLQDKAMNNLREYYNNGGKLVSHHIKGDLVSALGTHCGESREYDAYKACIEHHDGNKGKLTVLEKVSQKLTTSLLKIIQPIAFNNDISKYVEEYKVTNIIDYAWVVHETDSFFGALETPIMDVEFTKVPDTIKYNKTDTVELTIRTNVKIPDLMSRLVVSNFSLSNKNKLSIVRVDKKDEKFEDGKYIYKYIITIKGGKLIGNSNISLNAGAIRVEQNSTLLANIKISSKDIRTKLI